MRNRLTFLGLACTLLAACGGSGGGPEPADEPPPSGASHRVSGEVVDKRYDGTIAVFLQNADSAELYERLEVTDNGPFQFSTLVAAGDNIQVYSSVVGNTYLRDENFMARQICNTASGLVRDVQADVSVRVACEDVYHVFGTVEGLRGTRLSGNDNLILDTNKGNVHVSSSGPFDFGPYEAPENWSFEILQQPSNPEQECRIQGDSAGAIAGQDVMGVRVLCDLRTISGTVSGLRGSGLILNLSAQLQEDEDIVLNVEQLDIESDGTFEFETAVVDNGEYEVTVLQNPSDPDQECSVARGIGFASEDVADVAVTCPNPWRQWWFHDFETRGSQGPENPIGEPLGGLRERDAGVVYEEYVYPERNAVALGPMLGLENQVPFLDLLDDLSQQGVVSSSTDGKQFWLAVESAKGNPDAAAYLYTYWKFRKEAPDASFSLTISRVETGVYLDPQGQFVGAFSLPLGAISKLGYSVEARREGAWVPISGVAGAIELRGFTDRNRETYWQEFAYSPWDVPGSAFDDLWDVDDFEPDNSGRLPFAELGQLRRLRLREPIVVDFDLSAIPVSGEFRVVAGANVTAFNFFSQEGVAAAYLQDPTGYEPGDPPDESGGVVMDFSGLSMLPIDPNSDDLAPAGGISLESCPDGDNISMIEFYATEYQIPEDVVQGLEDIEVIRTNGIGGPAGARVVASSGTALAGTDFLRTEQFVGFGDLSNLPREIDPLIVDDDEAEGDETFTLTLVDPQGCAEIGARNTATVTILASDPPSGQVSFTSERYEFAENAGEALIEVERQGGQSGIIGINVASIDGTAVAGQHYAAVTEFIAFQDQEATAKALRIPLIDNAELDGDREFTVTLAAEDPDEQGTPAATVVVIRDDDGPDNTVSFSTGTLEIGEQDGMLGVTIARDSGDGAAGVRVVSSDGSAIAGEDYMAVDVRLEFSDGELEQTLSVSILDDALQEGDHTFRLELAEPTGGLVVGAPRIVTVSIVDDEIVSGPPAAPQLSTDPAVSGLQLQWTEVENTTAYRVLFDNGSGSPVQVGGDLPVGTSFQYIDIPLHLGDYSGASYVVQACNSEGCTGSNAVTVADLMVASIGFLKSSNSDTRDRFGSKVAISADGSTLAVSAPEEDSSATFVDGNQDDNTALGTGAVYVFERIATGWRQAAYIKAARTDTAVGFGAGLALSADGNRLVIGAPGERSSATGIDGDWNETTFGEFAFGAAYLYRREGGAWLFDTYFKASNAEPNDRFGSAVAVSADGSTIAVSALEEDSAATGVGGDQANNDAEASGATYVFSDSSGAWVQEAYVKAPNAEADDYFGHALALSGDGSRLAVSAIREDGGIAGINGDPNDNSLPGNGSRSTGTGAVYVYTRDTGVWSDQAYIKSSNIDADDMFGFSLSFSDDGSILVVGAQREDSSASGVNAPLETDNSSEDTGAAYVFRSNAGVWTQDAYLKASNTDRTEIFGASVAVSGDGRYIAVGATSESSLAVGVNGDQTQTSNVGVGAAYLFAWDGVWNQVSYVKASNSDQSQFPGSGRGIEFGRSIALSQDGQALAVGGAAEPSDARGIGGDQANENASLSGAVYLY